VSLVVDASAILAILFDEPDSKVYLNKLLAADRLWISPVNWWEVQVRIRTCHGEAGAAKAAAWMDTIGILIEPVTHAHAQLALEAFASYRGRPARLNLGDCFAYALAKEKRAALLYKGDHFSSTDIPRG
jgi:ribonuclease VapC